MRGREVAGRVEAVGKNVTTLRVGAEVFGTGEGTFADYAPARADKLAPMPKNLTAVQAAAAGVSGLTALQAVRDRGRVRPGQKVLVIGASGGVGTFAVQIAKAFGAEVTGVCRTSKVELVRSLGADHVIDYTRDDITTAGQRYDVILDIGGHRSLRAPVLSLLVGQKLCALINSENAQDLIVLTGLIESGAVTPTIDKTYPLSQTAEAIQYLQDGHAQGKVVITV